MLPRTYRLPLKTELNRLKKDGQIFQGKFFGLLLDPKENFKSSPRFGMIVSNKIAKKAVARNKIRRLLSESLIALCPQIKKNQDGVFLTKKTVTGANLTQIKKDIETLLKKAKLIS